MTNFLCALICFCFHIAFAQNSQTAYKHCNQDSLYSRLDFWIGKWIVYDSTETKEIGRNEIVRILKSCAVMENWTDADGSEGKSLFFVDNKIKTWRQIWVADEAEYPGGQKDKRMVHSEPDEVIFQGEIQLPTRTIQDRTILTLKSDGKVWQRIQTSSDEGKTWTTRFVGVYVKA